MCIPTNPLALADDLVRKFICHRYLKMERKDWNSFQEIQHNFWENKNRTKFSSLQLFSKCSVNAKKKKLPWREQAARSFWIDLQSLFQELTLFILQIRYSYFSFWKKLCFFKDSWCRWKACLGEPEKWREKKEMKYYLINKN